MKRKREAETVNRPGRPKLCSFDQFPEFFKVYLPEWNSQRLSIPPGFIKHFYGIIPKKLILQDLNGKFWHVDVEEDENAVFFANGWQEFVKDSSLEKGEFVVFRYDGNSSFTVRIFLKDGCMKGNDLVTANMLKVEAASDTESEEAERTDNYQNRLKGLEESRGNVKSSNRKINGRSSSSYSLAGVKIEDGILKAAKELMSSSQHPSFQIIMPRTYVEKGYMEIPSSFVKDHIKKDIKCVELLIANKSWPVNLTSRLRNRICKGWRQCQNANSIQLGEVCVFELIDRENPVLKVSIFRSQ